jgi:hypothetical protein
VDDVAVVATGTGLGVAGLALLVFEVVRVLTDETLGSVGTVLLWVGLGLLVAGGLLLLVATLTATAAPDRSPAER